ncbi:MAG: hypothetical protein KAH01_04910 [Caldisericia bacterium]|nr:hypothetical protein [Caldisericia bacterium]
MNTKRYLSFFTIIAIFISFISSNALYTKAAINERVDYLVISAPGLTAALSPLLKHRQKQGLQTAIYETGEIFNKYAGTTRQDQIRNFLISKYEAWSIRYVVLVGDKKVIPYETFYPFYPRDSAEYKNNEISSDFFFCSIDSNLDSNQNGYTGEFFGDDKISFHSEVRLGRIPFNKSYEVSTIIHRIIDLENRHLNKKTLLASSVLNYKNEETNKHTFIKERTDGAALTESIYSDLLSPLSYTTTRLGEKSGLTPSTYQAEYALKRKNFEYLLQKNQFDIVVWEGHGTTNNLISKIWTKDKNGNGNAERNELDEEIVLNSDSFNDVTQNHGLFISGCCSNLNPNEPTNLGKSALLNGFGCFIGGTSVNYYSTGWTNIKHGGNQTLIYLVTRNIVLRNESFGDALYNAIEECSKNYSLLGSYDYANFYSFNLLGDPASKLAPSFCRTFNASLDENHKAVQLGQNIYYTVSLESTGFTDSIYIAPINYDKDKFNVEVTPEKSSIPGYFIVKITPRTKIYPSSYTLTLQLMSPSKTVFLCPRFTILPYGSKPRVYLNFPEWHLKKNSTFTIDVYAQDLSNVDSTFIELSYDQSIISLTENGIFVGTFLTKDGVVPKSQKSSYGNGTASITLSREHIRDGVSGNGRIASFTFLTKKNGFSTISLSKVICMNPSRKHLECDTNNSRITVSDLGMHINPSIPLFENVTKRSYFEEGKTNGNKIWFIENKSEILLDKTGKTSFITHFASKERNNTLTWLVQKDNSFAQITSKITFNNVTEIHLWVGSYWAYINENSSTLDSPPLIQNGRTMAPLRFISEAFNTDIFWNPTDSTITLIKGTQKIILTIGNNKAIVENQGISTIVMLDAPPIIVKSRTLVPLRFISETFNADIKWVQDYNLIKISYISL